MIYWKNYLKIHVDKIVQNIKSIYIIFSFVISKIIKKVILIDIKYRFTLTYFYT